MLYSQDKEWGRSSQLNFRIDPSTCDSEKLSASEGRAANGPPGKPAHSLSWEPPGLFGLQVGKYLAPTLSPSESPLSERQKGPEEPHLQSSIEAGR